MFEGFLSCMTELGPLIDLYYAAWKKEMKCKESCSVHQTSQESEGEGAEEGRKGEAGKEKKKK